MRTQVAIVGAGPAGLLSCRSCIVTASTLSHWKKHSREHVLSRIRAGVLEQAR